MSLYISNLLYLISNVYRINFFKFYKKFKKIILENIEVIYYKIFYYILNFFDNKNYYLKNDLLIINLINIYSIFLILIETR